jgi:hypothetical protein
MLSYIITFFINIFLLKSITKPPSPEGRDLEALYNFFETPDSDYTISEKDFKSDLLVSKTVSPTMRVI